MKQTKIIATIGPATETEETLAQLIKAGMNVARFNTKHGTSEWHRERIIRVKKVAQELNTPVAILLDLQGPEIRINVPGEAGYEVPAGKTTFFSSDLGEYSDNVAIIPQQVVESLPVGSIVLLEDGACEFKVVNKFKTSFEAEAVVDSVVKHRKTMNTPGVVIDMPSLIPADLEKLEATKDLNLDFVGLSFVRNAADIAILREELKKRSMKTAVVAKIENQMAVDNIDEIIDASDAVMVARGDLGVEVPYTELIYWQRTIIDKCRETAKPVITATEMLKSMVEKPRPTRAEVSDVAHAIYDGTDAIMLSDETTIGKHPVKAVGIQASIAEYNEQFVELMDPDCEDDDTAQAITHAAINLLYTTALPISKIICLTETGYTARLVSRFRPMQPIMAVTSNEHTYRKLALSYGVRPFIIDMQESRLNALDNLSDKLKELGVVEVGETVLVIHGTHWKTPGLTNTIAVVNVE